MANKVITKMIEINEDKIISQIRFHYISPNGKIEGYAVVPQTTTPCPVIIFCRGGNRDYGSIEQNALLKVMTPLALAGFAVIGSQYSGGPNSEGKDEYGGKDVQDVVSLLESFKKDTWELDFNRVGILGISRGAMMGMQVLRDGMRINRAAYIGGLYDCQKMKEERPDVYGMWERDQLFDFNSADQLKKRSAITFGDKLPNIPYLLLHSRGDSKVAVRQAQEMKQVLGDRAELILFENDDHGLRQVAQQRNKLLIDWFSKM